MEQQENKPQGMEQEVREEMEAEAQPLSAQERQQEAGAEEEKVEEEAGKDNAQGEQEEEPEVVEELVKNQAQSVNQPEEQAQAQVDEPDEHAEPQAQKEQEVAAVIPEQPAAQQPAEATAVLDHSYLELLERRLERNSETLMTSNQEIQALKTLNQQHQSELEKAKQGAHELKKIKMDMFLEKMAMQKELEHLKKETASQQEQLEDINKIGDVRLLQSTLKDLQELTQAQQAEIKQLNEREEQRKQQKEDEKGIMVLLNEYQGQRKLTELQNLDLSASLEEQKRLNAQQLTAKNEIQREMTQCKSYIRVLEQEKESLSSQVQRWKRTNEGLEEEMRELRRKSQIEQRVDQYQSQKFVGIEADIPTIPLLTDKQEKDLLLREYLHLESQNMQLKSQLELVQGKLRRQEQEYRKKNGETVRKKQYKELHARYLKARTALEAAYVKIREWEGRQDEREAKEVVAQLLEGGAERESQLLMKQAQSQIRQIQEQAEAMEADDELQKLHNMYAKAQQDIIDLKQEAKLNTKIIQLMSEDLESKDFLLKDRTNQLIRLKERQPVSDPELQIKASQAEVLQADLHALQAQTLLLIRESSSHQSQAAHWQQLYQQLKEQLSNKVTLALEEKDHKPMEKEPQQENPLMREYQEMRQEIQRKALVDTEVQVDGEGIRLHYNEMKESLKVIQKVEKEIEKVPDTFQKGRRVLVETKERMERLTEKYNTKLMEVRREKADNESWRVRAKEEIREEFNDVRDLVLNGRLVTALRQATSLIGYLQEHQKEEEEEEGAAGEESAKENE